MKLVPRLDSSEEGRQNRFQGGEIISGKGKIITGKGERYVMMY